MTNMGEKLTEEEASDMIACADSDAQGDIDYKGKPNFVQFLWAIMRFKQDVHNLKH